MRLLLPQIHYYLGQCTSTFSQTPGAMTLDVLNGDIRIKSNVAHECLKMWMDMDELVRPSPCRICVKFCLVLVSVNGIH